MGDWTAEELSSDWVFAILGWPIQEGLTSEGGTNVKQITKNYNTS